MSGRKVGCEKDMEWGGKGNAPRFTGIERGDDWAGIVVNNWVARFRVTVARTGGTWWYIISGNCNHGRCLNACMERQVGGYMWTGHLHEESVCSCFLAFSVASSGILMQINGPYSSVRSGVHIIAMLCHILLVSVY